MLTKTQRDTILSRYESGGYAEAGKAAVQFLRGDAVDVTDDLESIALMAEASELHDIAAVARKALAAANA